MNAVTSNRAMLAPGGPVEAIAWKVVPPGRPDDLASVILDVVADTVRARARAVVARERVRTRFDAARLVEATEAMYVDVLDRRRYGHSRPPSSDGGRTP